MQHIEHINPILNVTDMARSLRFYVGVLGFENAEWGNDGFTCVSRDGQSIYLCKGGQGHAGMWIWMGIEDVRSMHDHLLANGVKIPKGLTKESWALEMHVEDPDGHVLRMGSEPE